MGIYNLSYEKRLLDLLGYEYIDDTPGKWIILDDNKKNVGYIEVFPNTTTYTTEYSYHMVIDSDTVNFDDTRDEDNLLYTFKVKGVGFVVLSLGTVYYDVLYDEDVLRIFGPDDYSSMAIGHRFGTCNNYHLNAEDNGIIFEYSYLINGYMVSETVKFRNKDLGVDNWAKAYRYDLYYHKEDEEYKDGVGYRLLSYIATDDPEYLYTTKKLYGKDIDEKNNEFDYLTSAKTPEEFAIKHKRGLELIKEGIKYINNVLPFKKDIIYEYFKEYIDEYNLGIIFDEKHKTK